VCCSVLQCVAVYCSVLQCIAVYCSVLQCIAVCFSVLQCVAVCCRVLQCTALCCSVLQCAAVCCSVLQCIAVSYVAPKSFQTSAPAVVTRFNGTRFWAPISIFHIPCVTEDIWMSHITRMSHIWMSHVTQIQRNTLLSTHLLHLAHSVSCDVSCHGFVHVTWLTHIRVMCDMTHSYTWHDSLICVTWLIHTCDMNISYVCMTHLKFIWHASSIGATWLIHLFGTTHSYKWHDSFNGTSSCFYFLFLSPHLYFPDSLWWVMSYIWTCHVTRMNESCHTYEWVMSYIWTCHVTRHVTRIHLANRCSRFLIWGGFD